MLNIRENRDNLIKRAMASIQEDYEYEPSEIIQALFESDSEIPVDGFKNRKIKEARAAKQKLEENQTFFKNSDSYIKRVTTKDKNTEKDSNE